MPMLDIFSSSAFSVLSLTDAINKIPFVPGRLGQAIDWDESGVTTTTIAIEEISGELKLLNPTPRGGPGETSPKQDRKIRDLRIPHYQHDDAIMAEEVQGVRAFGQANVIETVQGRVNARLAEHAKLKLDPTLEYQRIGAMKGIILNANGTTLYNLFTEFNVSQPEAINFQLNSTSTKVRLKCAQVIRTIANALGAIPYRAIRCMCGDEFWDKLVTHADVEETFKYQDGARNRQDIVWQTLDFGGITFENYRGGIGNTPFIEPTKGHAFPVGVPGLWRTVYAPADYIETVNTPGLPRYAKQYRLPNDKGIALESQMNALNYCTRPNALVEVRLG